MRNLVKNQNKLEELIFQIKNDKNILNSGKNFFNKFYDEIDSKTIIKSIMSLEELKGYSKSSFAWTDEKQCSTNTCQTIILSELPKSISLNDIDDYNNIKCDKDSLLKLLLKIENFRKEFDYINSGVCDSSIRICQAQIAKEFFDSRTDWINILKRKYGLKY